MKPTWTRCAPCISMSGVVSKQAWWALAHVATSFSILTRGSVMVHLEGRLHVRGGDSRSLDGTSGRSLVGGCLRVKPGGYRPRGTPIALGRSPRTAEGLSRLLSTSGVARGGPWLHTLSSGRPAAGGQRTDALDAWRTVLDSARRKGHILSTIGPPPAPANCRAYNPGGASRDAIPADPGPDLLRRQRLPGRNSWARSFTGFSAAPSSRCSRPRSSCGAPPAS